MIMPLKIRYVTQLPAISSADIYSDGSYYTATLSTTYATVSTITLTPADFRLLFGQPISLVISFEGYIAAAASYWRVLVNGIQVQEQHASDNNTHLPAHYFIHPSLDKNNICTILIQGKGGTGTPTYIMKNIKVTARIRET